MVQTITALPTVPSRAARPDTFSPEADAFWGAMPAFRAELNQFAVDVTAMVSGMDFNGTSTTSTTIGTGTKVFTVQAGKLWQVGQFVVVAYTTTPANYMFGQVQSYVGTSLTVNVTSVGGSGTQALWTIGLAAIGGITASGAETLTNKTIALGSNAISGTLAQFNAACTDADFAAAGWTQIAQLATTSGTKQTFSSIPQTYGELLAVIEGVSLSGANSISIAMSSNGSSYTGAVNVATLGNALDTIYGVACIPGYSKNAGGVWYSAGQMNAAPATSINGGSFAWRLASGVQYVQFGATGGASFDAGTITLYGR